MEGRLVMGDDGAVRFPGVDMGGLGKVLAQNNGVIVVKWPANMGWYCRGSRKYYSPRTAAYAKDKTISDTEWEVTELIAWGPKKKVGKIYRGMRLEPDQTTLPDILVAVDGKPLEHIVRHSPDGFEWGYGGSGPADLALSILTDVFGGRVELANLYYQEFKFDFVAGWGDTWVVYENVVSQWLSKKTGNGVEALVKKFDAMDEGQRREVKYSRRMP
jgi:hypothetical protein